MSQFLRLIRAVGAETATDRELLDRFTRDRDEEAFATLVHRHGGAVWATCQRLAVWDAEDAFQAVFLILARKAGSVRGPLPAWLHEVARRVASNLRRSARRRANTEAASARPAEASSDDVTFRDGMAALDEELTRLPERYRAVLIVCCLEGRSRDEAAAQLGWTDNQVKGRLERARELLRARLRRRGLELGALLLGAVGGGSARAVPTTNVLATGTSPVAVSLADGVSHTMLVEKLRVVVAAFAVTATVAGSLLISATRPGAAAPPAKAEDKADAAPTDKDLLQGLWQAIELEANGKKAPAEVAKKFQVRIKGDKLAFNPDSEDREHTFELDPSAKPKAMNLTPSDGPDKGKKLPRAIYRLDGDTLTICIDKGAPDGKRPTEFKTAEGSEHGLLTLKRVKPEK